MSSPLVYLAGIVVLGVAAQWVAWRLKFPAILLLLAAGFALGRLVAPEEVVPEGLLRAAVALSVAVILFEGGLGLRFRDLAETGSALSRLVTVGCAVTWVLATLLGRLFVFETWQVAALAGALLTVTGPTVIGPLLRHVRATRRAAAVARWEGIVIDPIGASLAVLVFEAVRAGGPEGAAQSVAAAVVRTVGFGFAAGGAGAGLIVLLLRRRWVPDYLEAPLLLAAVVGAYALADLGQHEAGLLAVTVMGVALANQRLVDVEHLARFKESLGVLLVSVLFVVLSGRLRPEAVLALGIGGAAFVAGMIVLVRPLSVLAATAGSPLSWPERAFLGWLAPRGIVAAAVSSVLAADLARTASSDAVRGDAELFVPLTFAVIVATVTVYGLTAKALAGRLGVADPDPQGLLVVGAGPLARAVAKAAEAAGFPVRLIDSHRGNVLAARLEGLDVRHGNVLSEAVRDELDLAGLGRLLALTPNDELNALAAQAFTGEFERAGVYQLPPPRDEARRKGGETRVSARRLFAEEATHEELTRRLRDGATIKSTPLTGQFDYETFRSNYGRRAVPLFLVRADGRRLAVWTADAPPTPAAGDRLVSLVEAGTPAEPPAG